MKLKALFKKKKEGGEGDCANMIIIIQLQKN